MHIAIDISQVIYGTGVSVYTRELVVNLIKYFPDNEYVLFGGSLRRNGELREFAAQFAKARSVITRISPTLADLVWNRLHILPVEAFVGKVDIFHSSDWTEPPAGACKVTTIHDLAFLHYPEWTDGKILSTHRRRLGWVKKESARIIVPSLATRNDAVGLGIPEKKISVIYEAPGDNFKKVEISKIKKTRSKYNITGNYALAVGASPRKNIERIINAFEKAKLQAGLDELVVVGRGETRGDAKFLGHVDAEDMPALYSGACVFVYPSLYEGFGLPILEAFCAGVPVVTSKVSSMPEVAGGASVLVDPLSVESISDGILAARRRSIDLVIKGKARVREFSWEKTARETMEVYRSLV